MIRGSIYNLGNDNWLLLEVLKVDDFYQAFITVNQHGSIELDKGTYLQLEEMETVVCDNGEDLKLLFDNFFNKGNLCNLNNN